MLLASGLPKSLWGFALRYMNRIHNYTARRRINFETPYHARFNELPNISDLRPFGAICYVRRQTKTPKLDARAEEGRWLGPDDTSNGYWVYWSTTRRATIERNIVFSTREPSIVEGEELDLDLDRVNEQVPALVPGTHTIPIESTPDLESVEIPSDVIIPEPIESASGKRVRKPSAKIRAILEGKAITGDELDESDEVIAANLVHAMSDVAAADPRTLAEAMKRPNWPAIKASMDDDDTWLKRWTAN